MVVTSEVSKLSGWLKADADCRLNMKNMELMVVTLEVSKLSVWSNARASCRAERRGMRCGARCGPGGGRV